jgi:hypothetical protein
MAGTKSRTAIVVSLLATVLAIACHSFCTKLVAEGAEDVHEVAAADR